MIRADDRVDRVLARDERLVEAFVAVSPAFERLRSPGMRRVMARLVTVRQAARVAGVSPELLVDRLNRTLEAGGAPPASPNPENEPMQSSTIRPPKELEEIPADRVHDLDVRDDLRSGREPFSRIMAARRDLPPGGVLRLRAIFEPAPLYAVMGRQGFAHWTERLADDDWRVWFYEAGAAGEADGPSPHPAPADDGDGDGKDVVVLDVRGLEPPEPMVRTLEALERLPAGRTLVQLNERVPRFLLPELEKRGFRYRIREQPERPVRLFIRREAE